MKKLFLILLTLITLGANAQQTFQFSEKDGQKLYLDVYKSQNPDNRKPLFIYVFGGGFMEGVRNNPHFLPFINILNNNGYNVVCIDYRLGLKDSKDKGLKMIYKSIQMAAEDLLTATNWLINNQNQTGVNADRIVTCGSSAGAITVLQADYELNNGFPLSKIVPDGFRFSGVIAFSGAIFSKKGLVKYRKHNPAPTMFIHGTDDKIVTYNQIHLFRWSFSGASKLAKRFEKYEYPYYIYRYKGLQHEVNFYCERNINDVMNFIDNYVIKGKHLRNDFTYMDPDNQNTTKAKSTKEYYKQ